MLDTSDELSVVDASAVATGAIDAKPQANVRQLTVVNLPAGMASIFQEASEKWGRKMQDAQAEKGDSKGGGRQSSLATAAGIIPVVIQWRGLRYSVPIAKDKPPRVILNGITGAASPCHVLAVMGPTGSGKTSLLNTLAGRVPVGGTLNGEILVNGLPRTEQFKTQAAYVEQDELAFPFLSVRETFTLHARLRLPAAAPSEFKEQSVEAAITELGLTKVADAMVGGGMVRGLSGGERKRCSIGVELVTNPQALFLDEPTSGLDSFQAQNVVGMLSSLAQNSRTVLTTIHQPRSSIFHLFDQLCLLVEGELIYLGGAKEAVQYFNSLHFSCPNHTNPADFFMDVLSMDYRDAEWEKDSKERIQLFSDACAQNRLGERSHSEAEMHIINASSASSVRAEASAGLVEQYILLSGRAWRSVLRNKIGMVITLVIALTYSLLISALYRNIGNDQRSLQDRAGALFFIALNTAYGVAIPATQFFAPEKAVVNRERASRAYSVATYFWSKYWAEVPLKVAEQLVFGGILYYIVGFNNDFERFAAFLLICILGALSAQAFGFVMAAGLPPTAANQLCPTILTILSVFAGIYINLDSIPEGASWIRYVNFVYYQFAGLMNNEFHGETGYTCESDDESCLTTGEQVLEAWSLQEMDIRTAIIAQALLQFGAQVIAFALLFANGPKYMPMQATLASPQLPISEHQIVVQKPTEATDL